MRMEDLHEEDKGLQLRKSHQNPEIKEIYAAFLEKLGSELAHRLLHTTYVDRS
jgi:hypothetical protein